VLWWNAALVESRNEDFREKAMAILLHWLIQCSQCSKRLSSGIASARSADRPLACLMRLRLGGLLLSSLVGRALHPVEGIAWSRIAEKVAHVEHQS